VSPRRPCVTLLAVAVAVGGALGAALAGCGGGKERGGGAARRAHDPIIFVHGLGGSPRAWNTMVARFRADGWSAAELDAWGYDSSRSNQETAVVLRDEVLRLLAATGRRRVDLVTHSMGGLSSRWFLSRLRGTALVDHWVSLAGPNHGIAGAPLCAAASCEELRAGSSLLRALNRGDETPGTTAYGVWWSPCDAIVRPVASAELAGARNVRTACLSHGALTTDATVYAQVRDFLAGS
jgi:triacylglycerol lipase